MTKKQEEEQIHDAPDQIQEKPTVGSMQTGDYMIHVYVIQGKNFSTDDDETVNPVINISTCGIAKYTSSKSDVATNSQTPISWREHLFFEPRNVHSSKIELDTISIKVMNKGMFRDELIGLYEFDITSVYFKEKHTLQHQWIALFNPEGADFSQITGNLQISISVQGPGDEQVQLNDQTGPEAASQITLMPAQIKKQFKQLKIRFITAEKLPDMDWMGTCDAYIKTNFLGRTLKTQVVAQKKDAAPLEYEFWLPIQWPLASDRLVLQLYDEDPVTDEIVGSMFFSLKNLIREGEVEGGRYFWQNLYGSHVGYSGSVSDAMNDNPELGSSWKGRVLMHIEAADAKHPERRAQILEETVKQSAIALGLFQESEYDVIAEIGMGVSLPNFDETYTVMIKIGEFEMTTSNPKEAKTGYNRWSERINQQTFKSAYPNFDQMADVFVYLMSGKHPVCYWKGKVKDFLDPNPTYRWIALKADKSVGKVENDYEAGMIQIKMSFAQRKGAGEQPITFKQFDAWKKPPPRRLGSRKIRCYLFQCRDIPSADSDGSSDAYISVWNNEGVKLATQTIEDSLNPIYFETIELMYDMVDLDTAPPIILNIWDTDEGLLNNSDDYLGRCVIYLQDASTNLHKGEEEEFCNEVPKPQWHDIRIGFDETQPASGQVLCSFIVARDDFDFQTPSQYMRLEEYVPTKEYTLDINVLGLRNLESFGLMPIKKPFVKFRVKSLLPPAKAQAVTNVSTDPNANGPNPNINTCLTFNVQLPTEELYCPSLACDVFDYVFRGMSQPLIGTFRIHVGALKTKQQKKRQADLDQCQQIIDFLNRQISKDGEQILKEAKEKVQSSMSVGAKKFMAKKIQQKTMKAALDIGLGKVEARKESARLISQKGPNGYDELMEDLEANQSVSQNQISLEQQQPIEENRLLIEATEEDPTLKTIVDNDPLLQNLEADDPLFIEGAQVRKIKQELKNFLVARQSSYNKSLSQTDAALKVNLEKRLKQQQIKYKEERKKAKKVQRELEKMEMQERGAEVHKNIILPVYEFNSDLQVYMEVNPPCSSIYKSVGFNDLNRVKILMEGDDNDKRSESLRAPSKLKTIRRKTTHTKNRALLQHEMEAAIEEERKMQITNLHYRKFYEDELENDRTLFADPEEPFVKIDIKRGQSRGLKKSWFSLFSSDKTDESGEITDLKTVGSFKGRVKVFNEQERKEFNAEKQEKIEEIFNLIKQIHQKCFKQELTTDMQELIESKEQLEKFKNTLQSMNIDNPALYEFFKDQSYEEMIKKQLLTKTNCKIQLYVLEGYDFASRDIGSFSDPYLKITCGEMTFDERKNYQIDEPNPKFYKLFNFTGEFPGAPPLVIEAYDYDDLFGDDLIGTTIIDLDDRFFSPDWQAIEEKPIEYRQIYHESTSLSQGVIQCWCEIEPDSKEARKTMKDWDIAPEPVMDYQIRLCVMDTKDVPCEDIEGTSDVFIKCYIDDKDKRTTDTHFRCQNGQASFNYRMLFDVQSPRKEPLLLVLQAWDLDIFKKNDYICEWTLDLEELFKNVRLTQERVHLTKAYYNAFLKKKMPPGVKLEFREDDSFSLTCMKDGKQISIRLDLRIVPHELAVTNGVGTGRQEPNLEPYLPPPIGRIQLSLNPFKMLSQMVSPEFLAKLYGLICVILVIVCCIAMAPMILSNFTSTITMKILGIM